MTANLNSPRIVQAGKLSEADIDAMIAARPPLRYRAHGAIVELRTHRPIVMAQAAGDAEDYPRCEHGLAPRREPGCTGNCCQGRLCDCLPDIDPPNDPPGWLQRACDRIQPRSFWIGYAAFLLCLLLAGTPIRLAR